MKEPRIPANLWVWIWSFLSVVVVLIAVFALEWGAHVLRHLAEHSCAPHQYLYLALKDIGPAIAGFLVLSAAFGAAATATWTFAKTKVELREAAKRVVEAEIRSFWWRVNDLNLSELFLKSVNETRHVAEKLKARPGSDDGRKEAEELSYKLVRRSFGQDWFVFSRTHPLELSRLPEIQGAYASLSIIALNLVSRLDYINQADARSQTFLFWHNEHQRVLNSLNEVLASSNAILARLKLESVSK